MTSENSSTILPFNLSYESNGKGAVYARSKIAEKTVFILLPDRGDHHDLVKQSGVSEC